MNSGSAIVALDTVGAFDRVWYQGLLINLQALRVSCPALCLLSDYLQEYLLRVGLNGTESTRYTIGASVQQESVLVSLLWNVCFRYLLQFIPEYHAHAEDCTLGFTYS